MGGWGSGYRGPSARLVEQCAKIDLADLKKHKTTLDEGEGVSMSGALSSRCNPGLRLRYWARHPRVLRSPCCSGTQLTVQETGAVGRWSALIPSAARLSRTEP
jgi:hypothetical protein